MDTVFGGCAGRSAAKAAAILILLLWPVGAIADSGWYPERRRSQFQKDPGHIVMPYVFNLPGIGWGYGVLGAVSNVGGSCTDVSASLMAGDINGVALGVDGVHVIPEHLILDLGGAFLSRTAIQSYTERGIASSKDETMSGEFKDSAYGGGRATASFLDRRLEAYLGFYGGEIKLAAIRDRDGELIAEAQDAPATWFSTWVFGARLDFTDDYLDPRRGARFEASLWRSPASDSGPDFYTTDYSLTGYLPLGRRSTWAFNYFRSDAHVLQQGETDPAAIADTQGLECGTIVDPVKQQKCRQYIDTIVAQNRYGSASSLGGLSRLRSYPLGRYSGAHAQFFGTEVRWNLTDEKTPFNIFIVKDVRTAIQLAFFYELGTVADTESELWSKTRSSYGVGCRIVTASGVVYRIDVAAGQEGVQTSIFFQYPWEI